MPYLYFQILDTIALGTGIVLFTATMIFMFHLTRIYQNELRAAKELAVTRRDGQARIKDMRSRHALVMAIMITTVVFSLTLAAGSAFRICIGSCRPDITEPFLFYKVICLAFAIASLCEVVLFCIVIYKRNRFEL